MAATIKAYIDGQPKTGQLTLDILAGSIGLTAGDQDDDGKMSISADVGTASIGIGIGLGAFAISVGVSVARNEISNEVSAYIANAATAGQIETPAHHHHRIFSRLDHGCWRSRLGCSWRRVCWCRFGGSRC